jgi:hypothetical protein
MGYGSTDEENERAHKTGRIAILSCLILLLGLFVFCYKTESCKSSPLNCKDEFFEIKNESGYRNEHACSPGAMAEVVNSPPAPKPGILCRCAANNPTPASKPGL